MFKKLHAALSSLVIASVMLFGCGSPAPADATTQTAAVSTVSSETSSAPRPEEMDREIDWKALEKKNPDICAWISIPGTNIDYPILQSDETKDDYYYLTKDLDEKTDVFGSIFSERYNRADFADPVTILYGHSSFMKDTPAGKEMFTDLHKYESQDYLDENPDVFIYTPDGNLHYELFCSSVFDDRYILGNYGFVDPEEVKLFISDLEKTKEHWINSEIKLPAQGHYLVLSTCMDVNSDQRLVLAALLKENDLEWGKAEEEAQKANTNKPLPSIKDQTTTRKETHSSAVVSQEASSTEKKK